MTKGQEDILNDQKSVQQKDVVILNEYAPSNKGSKHIKQELQKRRHIKYIILVKEFCILPLVSDRTCKAKNQKYVRFEDNKQT